MENASKALLIAGAILIVILLIAVGMMVFSGAQSNIEGSIASMSSQEKEAFNNQYSIYRGTQKGSTVKTLLNKMLANNESETGHTVALNGNTDSANISAKLDSITATKDYNVTFSYDSGVINNCTISE